MALSDYRHYTLIKPIKYSIDLLNMIIGLTADLVKCCIFKFEVKVKDV